jgi:hypothetical protein
MNDAEVKANEMSDNEALFDGSVAGDDYSETDINVSNDGVYEDVPQGETDSTTPHVNWESEAKKFQSMYDRTSVEKQKLENTMLKLAERSLDGSNQSNDVGRGNRDSTLSEDEFNPWDAYYKPDSPSYKFRAQQEHDSVNSVVSGHMAALNERVVLNNTVNELRNVYKLEDHEVSDFMEFATKPVDRLDLGTLVNVWKTSNTTGRTKRDSSLDAVKAAKEAPRTAGVLQGQSGSMPKSDKDKVWDAVMNAGGRSNVL